jgi:hypothetical protein
MTTVLVDPPPGADVAGVDHIIGQIAEIGCLVTAIAAR